MAVALTINNVGRDQDWRQMAPDKSQALGLNYSIQGYARPHIDQGGSICRFSVNPYRARDRNIALKAHYYVYPSSFSNESTEVEYRTRSDSCQSYFPMHGDTQHPSNCPTGKGPFGIEDDEDEVYSNRGILGMRAQPSTPSPKNCSRRNNSTITCMSRNPPSRRFFTSSCSTSSAIQRPRCRSSSTVNMSQGKCSSVKFGDEVEVITIPSHDALDAETRKCMWYTQDEYRQMISKNCSTAVDDV